jgi:hypothetical protein
LLAEAQSASDTQLDLHEVALAQTNPPAQAEEVPGMQEPKPLQVGAGVKVDPEHDAVPHEVPFAG